MSEEKYFMGIPVEGEIERQTRYNREQKPLEELQPLLSKLFEDPNVLGIKWEQYTPYFNDGDICEFGVGEVRVKLASVVNHLKEKSGQLDFDEDDELYGNGLGDYGDNYLSSWELDYYFRKGNDLEDVNVSASTKENYKQLSDQWNYFENVLQDEFGDPAQVKLTRDKVVVDFYEHD